MRSKLIRLGARRVREQVVEAQSREALDERVVFRVHPADRRDDVGREQRHEEDRAGVDFFALDWLFPWFVAFNRDPRWSWSFHHGTGLPSERSLTEPGTSRRRHRAYSGVAEESAHSPLLLPTTTGHVTYPVDHSISSGAFSGWGLVAMPQQAQSCFLN